MRKILVCLVMLSMLFTCVASAGGWFAGCSDWAEPELCDAIDNGIITYDDFVDYPGYGGKISREDFAMLVVRMYKGIKGENPVAAPSNTFTDTSNADVLRAYSAGIINGKGDGLFAPDDFVTRQEMAIMMSRALDSMKIDYAKGDGVLTVADKNSVANWAVDGVDFAYENGFIKGDGVNFFPLDNTPVEQAVIIINRVFEKYYTESVEPNDYTKGYDVSISDDNIYVTFHNNGQKIKIGEGYQYKVLDSDTSIIYCINNGVYRYNLKQKKVDWEYNNSYFVNFTLINGGKYDGYSVIKKGSGLAHHYYYIVLNSEQAEVGNIGLWENADDLNYKIDKLMNEYNRKTTGSDPFAIQVTDPSQSWDNVSFKEDYFKFYSNPYYSFSDDYLKITPRTSQDNNITPIAVLGNDSGYWGFNAYGGIYQVDVCLSSEEDNNAGIVFNVSGIADGYNNFLGFYAGIDADGDKVMLRRGKGVNTGDWKNLGDKKVGFDIKADTYYTLKVVKNGSSIEVYLNDVLYITESDDNFMDDVKMFGLRTWNKAAKFKNYSVNPLPY